MFRICFSANQSAGPGPQAGPQLRNKLNLNMLNLNKLNLNLSHLNEFFNPCHVFRFIGRNRLLCSHCSCCI